VSKVLAIAGGSMLVYVILALMMGVIPGIELSKTPAGPGVEPLTPLEVQGRNIYVANGCSYCHTQQVRPLAEDGVFGRPSAPGDFAYQTPELLGSERTGPDLTDVGMRRGSDVWQYMHLYNPRSVVPESIMPSFSWMFRVMDQAPPGVTPVPVPPAYAPRHGIVVPTLEARALVAYLVSLKQPPLPGAHGGTSAAAGANATLPPVAVMRAAATASTIHGDSGSGAGRSKAAAGSAASEAQIAHGRTLFLANCAVCHQASGEGLPGAFPPLKRNAAVNDANPTLHIHTVLFGAQGLEVGGVRYASVMPPFDAQLSDRDVADLINFERSAWGNQGKPVTGAQVAAVRARGR
jgi:cytochrome c oxidase cbb3-type subunit II